MFKGSSPNLASNLNKLIKFCSPEIMWFHGEQKLINLLNLGEPFKRLPHKMIKHTQAVCRQEPTNYLSVFDQEY